MARKKRRFSREFKIEVIREIEQGTKQAEVCRKHGLHPILVNKWRKKLKSYPNYLCTYRGSVQYILLLNKLFFLLEM